MLEELPNEVIDSLEFKKGITRRVISHVCAQMYDRHDHILEILNSSMKIILSQTCKVHPGLGSCIYVLSKPSKKTEGTQKVLEKNMNPLDTALEDLATSVENINDNNVSRVLSQQEKEEI